MRRAHHRSVDHPEFGRLGFRQRVGRHRHTDDEHHHTDNEHHHTDNEHHHTDDEHRHTDDEHHHTDNEHHHTDNEHHHTDDEHHHTDDEHHHTDNEHHHTDNEHHHTDNEHHHTDNEHHHTDNEHHHTDNEHHDEACGYAGDSPVRSVGGNARAIVNDVGVGGVGRFVHLAGGSELVRSPPGVVRDAVTGGWPVEHPGARSHSGVCRHDGGGDFGDAATIRPAGGTDRIGWGNVHLRGRPTGNVHWGEQHPDGGAQAVRVQPGEQVMAGQELLEAGWAGFSLKITVPDVASPVCEQPALGSWVAGTTVDVHALPTVGCGSPATGMATATGQPVVIVADPPSAGMANQMRHQLTAEHLRSQVVTLPSPLAQVPTSQWPAVIDQAVTNANATLAVVAGVYQPAPSPARLAAGIDGVLARLPAGTQVSWARPAPTQPNASTPAPMDPALSAGSPGTRTCECRPYSR